MKETQATLPGIPEAPKQNHWRVTYQAQGKNFILKAGSLIITASTIEEARRLGNGTLKDMNGDRWFNITKIQNVTEPF